MAIKRPTALIPALLAAWLLFPTVVLGKGTEAAAVSQEQTEKKDWQAPKTPAAESNSARTPSPKPARQRKSKGIRTLDEITIEGEIAVPQVLFIMARERHRYLDRLHRRYLKSSVEIGRETKFPTQFASQLLP